jgi:tetratricopeptide (TPR) repeat protein
MWDWIKWGEIEAAEIELDQSIIILLIYTTIIYLILDKNVALGLIGILIAIFAIRLSSDQLKIMQVDYWNARGIDNNQKGSEHKKQSAYYESSLAYDNAIQAFDKASELDPRNAKTWSNRGNALIAQGKYDKAIEAFDKAIKLDSQSPKAWNNRGTAFQAKSKALKDQGNDLDALCMYDKAMKPSS